MKVQLVSVTQSFIGNPNEEKFMTAEELLVYIARVSSPSNQMNTATSDKLIAYLIRNKHWSPFDMVNLCVEVVTSKAIGIQILRHWSIKPQEFSQRYAEVVDIEPIELRKAGATNRQSSEEVFDPEIEFNNGSKMKASVAIALHMKQTQGLYRHLLDAGVAKECARMVLPMASSTTLYLNGSIRSWIHYLEQRLSAHAQLEHRQVAMEIEKIFSVQFPNVYEAIIKP